MSNSGPDDFELLEKEKMSLEDYENTIYKPRTTGMLARFKGDDTVYPYSKLSDFKDLTPEQIISRRLHLIHPNMVDDKPNLEPLQKQAVTRLNILKKDFGTSPEKTQNKMRKILIDQMAKKEIKGTQDQSEVEQLIEQKKGEAAEDLKKRIKEAEELGRIQSRVRDLSGVPYVSQAELEKRVAALSQKGGSKRKTSKRKTSKRKTSSAKRTKRTSSSSTKRKASSSIKRKSILKRKNKKGKKTTKKRMVSFYL
jgi:hypothetical protein